MDWFAANFGVLPWSMHYITNIESDIDGDTAKVRASYCGGYYHHELVRTPDGWRSRHLREENVWFVNAPAQGHI